MKRTALQKAIAARLRAIDHLLGNLRAQLLAIDHKQHTLDIGIAEAHRDLQKIIERDGFPPVWKAAATHQAPPNPQ